MIEGAPFDTLDTAAAELGVAKKDAALIAIADTALAAVSEHPALPALEAANELHWADRERAETGYLPEDNVDRAIAKSHDAVRLGWREKVLDERRNDERGIS